MSTEYIAAYLPQCKLFEGCVTWMYLDTVGLVTIGVGNMLPDVDAALRLPLRVPSSGDLASEPAVRADFARVARMTRARVPSFYHEYEGVILRDEDIDALLTARLAAFDAKLRLEFPLFEVYPDYAKTALLDMVFNLGEAKLMHTYPSLDAAVRAQDWRRAAAECGRDQTNPAFVQRNAWTRTHFLAAGV